MRRRASDRFNPCYTFCRNRQEQGVTVWGCFSGHGRGNLVFLPHKAMMNTTRYITVLECKVVPTMAAHGCTEYLQVIVMKTILKSQLFFYDFVVRTRPHVINHSPAGLFSVMISIMMGLKNREKLCIIHGVTKSWVGGGWCKSCLG